MAFVSICVPVYHNAASLPTLLERLRDLAKRNSQDQFEFIFVDDGSKDSSFAVLSELHTTEPRMRVIKLARNFGSNAAIRAGLNASQGDAVVAIAADLQDPPELIDDMLARWREGRKTVLAARDSRDDPWMTSVMANTFYALFRRFAIASMPRGGFDFFLVDRQVCNELLGLRDANPYMMGQILWLGFDPATIYYHRREREKRFGVSMWTFFRKVKYFIDAFVAFSYAPVRLATIGGLALSLLGTIWAGVVMVGYLFGSNPPPGWASLMIGLLLISGAQMVMMGIFGEYLWRSLDQSRSRPLFIEEKRLEQNALAGTATTSKQRAA